MTREDEIKNRSERALAKARAVPAPSQRETTCGTQKAAEAKARRVGVPNAPVSATETTHGWVGVVHLRKADQLWAVRQVREKGCRVEFILDPRDFGGYSRSK